MVRRGTDAVVFDWARQLDGCRIEEVVPGGPACLSGTVGIGTPRALSGRFHLMAPRRKINELLEWARQSRILDFRYFDILDRSWTGAGSRRWCREALRASRASWSAAISSPTSTLSLSRSHPWTTALTVHRTSARQTLVRRVWPEGFRGRWRGASL